MIGMPNKFCDDCCRYGQERTDSWWRERRERMWRKWAVALVVCIALGVGCHHRVAAPPPAPPPVAPTAPPPAPPPPPAPAPAPVQDEYSRLKAMDVTALDRLGLLAD